MKALVLLTLALFLISAPAPDSATIGELSAQFIVVDDNGSLFASDVDRKESDEQKAENPETELSELEAEAKPKD
jgi:hypothetical protein